MIPYQCEYVPCDEKLRPLANQDAYDARFDFKVTPVQYLGQPDEQRHVKDRTVRITITGPAISAARIPRENLRAVLYWHALETLKQGKTELTINSEYVSAHGIDADRVEYPPTGPFQIMLTPQMGFHAR